MKFTRIVLLLLAALSASLSIAQQARRTPDPEEVARLVVRLTNEFRSQEGRENLQTSAHLTAAARYFADYLGQAEQLSHEADGSTAPARAEKHGYDSSCVWENIAHRYGSSGFATNELAQAFVEGWKKSPSHRRNMLESDATETGVAVAPGAKSGNYYAVQVFGRPASRAIQFEIVNRTASTLSYRLGDRTFPLAPQETRTHMQCRTEELTFTLARQARGQTFRPKRGDRFAVVRLESGELRVVARSSSP